MVELNELALENVIGGEVSKCVKKFAAGFAIYPAIPFLAAHDMVVSEEKAVLYKDAKLAAAGTILSAAACSALSIGAYEGVKFIRRKIKGRK